MTDHQITSTALAILGLVAIVFAVVATPTAKENDR